MYDFTEIVFTQNKNNVRLSKYSILFIILIVKTHENIWFNNLTAKYKPPILGIIYSQFNAKGYFLAHIIIMSFEKMCIVMRRTFFMYSY